MLKRCGIKRNEDEVLVDDAVWGGRESTHHHAVAEGEVKDGATVGVKFLGSAVAR